MLSQKSLFKPNILLGKYLILPLVICLSFTLINFNSKNVSALFKPNLSVSISDDQVNVNGNQIINSVSQTSELPIQVTVNTNNKTGYTATLNTETNETALVNTASTNGMKIESIDASKALANFSENTWGFLSPTGGDYQPVPSLLSPENLLRTTTKTSGNDNFNFKIGMKLSSNLESGSYANKLVVSIISNPYTPIAIMTEGPDFNAKLKSLEDFDSRIEHFKKSSVAPAASINAVNIEDEESDYEIKLWLDPTDNTVYYYTEAEKVYLNMDSNNMFYFLPDLISLDLSSFDTSQVTDMRYMFNYTYRLISLNLSNFDTSQVTNMSYMFFNASSLTLLNLSNFDTSQVMNMDSIFRGMINLTTIDLSNFDTSKVEDMSSMFFDVRNLTTLDLSNFNTSKVMYMNLMFSDMHNLTTLNLSNFDTSKVTNMEGMFSEVSKLTNLDLSSFDTSRVTNMGLMFSFASKLASLNLSNFNTSQVTVMNRMFSNMSNLASLDLSSFDTSQVTEMSYMFYNTPNLTSLDLSTFDASKVTDMNSIFALANSYVSKDKLETIYVNNDFNISKLKISPLMFNNRKKLRGGNGSFLANPSQADKSWLHIDDPTNSRPGYFTRKP